MVDAKTVQARTPRPGDADIQPKILQGTTIGFILTIRLVKNTMQVTRATDDQCCPSSNFTSQETGFQLSRLLRDCRTA